MSRIHDALKKAAEERASRAQVALSPVFADVVEEIHHPSQAEDDRQTTATNGSRPSGTQQSIRFEELLKRCTRLRWTPDPRISVFVGDTEGGAEPFRTLRSRLYQIASTRKLKRVLVTSSVPAEGKTFVAANLAHSIVHQADRRVLLIDADLRASRLHLALGAPSSPGLSDYLGGAVDECAVVQSGPDEKLCFIPGGSEVSNPSELLLSEKMSSLLNMVTPLFDFVILDSPPATPVHDSSLLADLCDGLLFVVRAGVTDFEMAQRAVAEFKEKNLLGVVLNGVEEKETYAQYYYPSRRD